jgi:pantoate kinase
MDNENRDIHEGQAYSPGHITGLFQICDMSENILEKGSRGAGLCISRGAASSVKIKTLDPTDPDNIQHQIQVILNGTLTSTAHTTMRAVELLLEKCQKNGIIENDLNIEIRIDNELPLGQGFGLSGAGAVSTALALNEALGSPLSGQHLFEFAHRAEVELGTGLGDVGAQSMGGVPIRVKPGIPPYGEINRLEGEFKGVNIEDLNLIICIIDSELSTKNILNDPVKRNLINKYGEIYLEKLINKPSIENLFINSLKFARNTNLMSSKVNKVVHQLNTRSCLASMSMLGNSIFTLAQNDHSDILKILEPYGPTYTCKIDSVGARVLTK